jgi:hypothetical protein
MRLDEMFHTLALFSEGRKSLKDMMSKNIAQRMFGILKFAFWKYILT